MASRQQEPGTDDSAICEIFPDLQVDSLVTDIASFPTLSPDDVQRSLSVEGTIAFSAVCEQRSQALQTSSLPSTSNVFMNWDQQPPPPIDCGTEYSGVRDEGDAFPKSLAYGQYHQDHQAPFEHLGLQTSPTDPIYQGLISVGGVLQQSLDSGSANTACQGQTVSGYNLLRMDPVGLNNPELYPFSQWSSDPSYQGSSIFQEHQDTRLADQNSCIISGKNIHSPSTLPQSDYPRSIVSNDLSESSLLLESNLSEGTNIPALSDAQRYPPLLTNAQSSSLLASDAQGSSHVAPGVQSSPLITTAMVDPAGFDQESAGTSSTITVSRPSAFPYRYRERRKFIPEGEEKKTRKKKLGNIRFTDFNEREKRHRINLGSQLGNLEMTNRELNATCGELEAMKKRCQEIYREYKEYMPENCYSNK